MVSGLSTRLKEGRKLAGLSQKEVAQRIGVSPSIISSYETGDRTPSTENLLALAYLYRLSTDYLLGRADSSSPIVIDTANLTPEQIQLINQLLQTVSSFDPSGG